MQYYFYWVLVVVISLWISLLAFIWGIMSGQFSDQGRARYLALSEDLYFPSDEERTKGGKERYALISIVSTGFLVLLFVIVLSLYRLKG